MSKCRVCLLFVFVYVHFDDYKQNDKFDEYAPYSHRVDAGPKNIRYAYTDYLLFSLSLSVIPSFSHAHSLMIVEFSQNSTRFVSFMLLASQHFIANNLFKLTAKYSP